MRSLIDEIMEVDMAVEVLHETGCQCGRCSKTNHPKGCHCPSCAKRAGRFVRSESGSLLDEILLESIDFESAGQFVIEDFTSQARLSECSSRRGHNCRSGTRPLSQVDSIVLHQTAGSQSTNPNRFLSIPTHFVVLSNGRILQLYRETDNIMHGHGLNSQSVGIEFAGTFANDGGKCWMGDAYREKGYTSGSLVCSEPTQAQIAAGRFLVTTLFNNIPAVWYILAHRQAHSSRANDPGPTIWLQIAEWAKANVGFRDLDNYTIGSGRPIPSSWRQGSILP